MKWYLEVLGKYADFKGRSRRREYWIFGLMNALITLVLGFVEGLLDIAPQLQISLLGLVYSLGVLLPSLAVSVRRLHDIGRAGWWLFIVFIPIVGAIVLVVFHLRDSQPGENRFGPNPKGLVTA